MRSTHIRRPFLTKVSASPPRDLPLTASTTKGQSRGGDADTFVRKGLRMCVERIDKNESGFYHRHHGIWLTLRSCTRSALVLLAARNSPELCLSMPPDWETAIEKVMAML